MEWIFLLFLFVQITHQTSRKVTFGDMTGVLNITTWYPSFNRYVINCIYQDRNNPKQLIFGVYNALFTSSLSEDPRSIKLLAGNLSIAGYEEGEGENAKFDFPQAIAQIDSGYIVSDSGNHCLRLIQPTTLSSGEKVWQTSTYAGKCTFVGSVDGQKLNARFQLPRGIVEHNNVLYITGDKKIRQLDLISGEVTTLHPNLAADTRQFVLGENNREFYATTIDKILHIEENKESWLVGCAGNDSLQAAVTRFSKTRLTWVNSIAKLSDDLLLVTDNHTVKLIDLESKEVHRICTGARGSVYGHVDRCRLDYAYSISVLDDIILIGEAASIRALPYSLTDTLQFNRTKSNSTPFPATHIDTFTSHILPADQSRVACKEPPTISNTRYTTLDSYTEGTEIYYQCIDSYMLVDEMNNKLTCTSDGVNTYWDGEEILCRPSKSLVAVMALTPVYVLTLLALVLVNVKQSRELRRYAGQGIDAKNLAIAPKQQSTRPTPLPRQPTTVAVEDYESIRDESTYSVSVSGEDDTHYISPYMGPSIQTPSTNSRV